jgi:hypothetical protein
MYVIVNFTIVLLRVLYRTEKINKKFFQSINLKDMDAHWLFIHKDNQAYKYPRLCW